MAGLSLKDVLRGLAPQLEKAASDMGNTSHPIGSVPTPGQAATRGSGDARDAKDMKEMTGPTSTEGRGVVNETGKQEDAQTQAGIKKTEIGNDPAVEQKYKTTLSDPGTTHPAKNEGSTVEKYASYSDSQLAEIHDALADSILADFAAGVAQPKQASAQPVAAQPVAAQGSSQAINPNFAAGYELASALGVEKAAAEATVLATAERIIKEACDDADRVGEYIHAYMRKLAADETDDSTEGEDPSKGDGSSESSAEKGSGGPAASGPGASDYAPAGEGGAAGGDLAGLMGGGAPGGDPAMGGDPAAGMPAPSDDQAMTELLSALNELGISPEEIIQAAAGGDPAAGGGAPPMGGDPMAAAGGAPPMGGDPMAAMGGGAPPMGGMPPEDPSMKLASLLKSASNFRRKGRYEYKTANAGTSSRILRDSFKQVLSEMLS